MKTFSEIQEEILCECPMGYRLKGFCHDHNMSLEDFIVNFLKDYNKIYETWTNTLGMVVCTTYKRRTLRDIFLICRFYYPDCTLRQVKKILEESGFFIDVSGLPNKYGWSKRDKVED